MTTGQLSLLQAAASADPYPLYEQLVPRGLFYDEDAGTWVAASAAAVTEVLTVDGLGVRPEAIPVPPALLGTAAGAVFGRLVRMTDGSFHSTVKPIVTAALSAADTARAAESATQRAERILDAGGPDVLSRLMFEVPASVVGELAGLPTELDLPSLVRAFIGCIPPSAGPAELAAAVPAAARLCELLEPLVGSQRPGLTGQLHRAATGAGYRDPAVLVANAIGMMGQSYDATAGLIGNTLLSLGNTGAAVGADYLLEVARHDAPIQNTRRFAHVDVEVCGQRIAVGQPILALLAAANRDPAANPDPARFNPDRPEPRLFTFGAGSHACPGRLLAVVIATAVVQAAVTAGVSTPQEATSYLPLANARIPQL
jgi:cytochrome P450